MGTTMTVDGFGQVIARPAWPPFIKRLLKYTLQKV